MALFQDVVSLAQIRGKIPLLLAVADYNPTVLHLVTLPNFILTWALATRHENTIIGSAFDGDEELELTSDVIKAFSGFMSSNNINLTFLSGSWSEGFVDRLFDSMTALRSDGNDMFLLVGADTIYSPFAMAAFTETMISILRREQHDYPLASSLAVVGAKRHYFGVGGSLDDFVEVSRGQGCSVEWLREEGNGVRRGVVRCELC